MQPHTQEREPSNPPELEDVSADGDSSFNYFLNRTDSLPSLDSLSHPTESTSPLSQSFVSSSNPNDFPALPSNHSQHVQYPNMSQPAFSHGQSTTSTSPAASTHSLPASLPASGKVPKKTKNRSHAAKLLAAAARASALAAKVAVANWVDEVDRAIKRIGNDLGARSFAQNGFAKPHIAQDWADEEMLKHDLDPPSRRHREEVWKRVCLLSIF